MVDYVILSPTLFPYISEFEVLPFVPITSDAHCGLHFSLTCNDMKREQHTHDDDNSVTITRAKWNSVESASIVGLLNGNKIDSFIRKIDALNTNEQLSTQVINERTSECSSILTETAKEIGCIKEIKIRPPNPKTSSKTKLLSSLSSTMNVLN